MACTCSCCCGACCTISGNSVSCSLDDKDGCQGTGKSWRGGGTTCTTGTCPQTSACCVGSGTGLSTCVTVFSQQECQSLGGSWLGAGTSCSGSNPCVYACCAGSTCYERGIGFGGACNGTDVFKGYGTSCSTNPCVTCNNSCITRTFSISGLTGSPCSSTTPYGQITVSVPAGCTCVTITGTVDDDLAIDGTRIQAGMFTTPSFPSCNPVHNVNYTFPKTGSFTLAALDNYGPGASYNLTICFSTSCSGSLSAVNAVAVQSATETKGPGTEMKKLLAKIGITSSPDCQCNARARYMDEQGPEWCEQNMAEILGWLREEAEKRKLPFVDFAGRLLVKKAIANARKNGQ